MRSDTQIAGVVNTDVRAAAAKAHFVRKADLHTPKLLRYRPMSGLRKLHCSAWLVGECPDRAEPAIRRDATKHLHLGQEQDGLRAEDRRAHQKRDRPFGRACHVAGFSICLRTASSAKTGTASAMATRVTCRPSHVARTVDASAAV